MLPQLAALLLGFILSTALIPRVIRVARLNRILDYPDQDRRVHPEPIPRMGGVALFAAVALASAVVFLWDRFETSFNFAASPTRLGFIVGCVIVFVTGIVDDIRGVSPVLKLTTQTIAAVMVILYGFRIDLITLTGSTVFSLGILSIPITILWIVGMTNAFNLIDGVDGLAGTFALIGIASSIGVDFYLHGSPVMVMRLAMLGAVIAFLRYNRSPARIFLGDSGSMLLGYFLAVSTVTSATVANRVTYAVIPIFALAYPLTDTFIAMARRWLRGHPISRADGRHVHHQILALGLSPTRTVEMLGLFFSAAAVMGIAIVLAPPRVTLVLGMTGMVLMFSAFWYGVKWLKYNEFIELGASITSVLRNARSHVRNKVLAGEIAQKLRSANTIVELKTMLGACASEFNLLEIGIIDGSPHFPGPANRQISPPSQHPYRLDYPIAWEEGGRSREVVLRLWCERPNERRHAGAERIASRLGDALEKWIIEHPGTFVAGAPVDMKRVTPRGLHRPT